MIAAVGGFRHVFGTIRDGAAVAEATGLVDLHGYPDPPGGPAPASRHRQGSACYRSHAVRDALAGRQVRHLRTRPYRPQTSGKVERLNLTLKHEWAYATVYTSKQARLDDLARWQHHYNWHRPHMAHHGGTPMSAVNNLPAKHT